MIEEREEEIATPRRHESSDLLEARAASAYGAKKHARGRRGDVGHPDCRAALGIDHARVLDGVERAVQQVRESMEALERARDAPALRRRRQRATISRWWSFT